MNLNKVRAIAILGFSAPLLLFSQNCSQVDFQSTQGTKKAESGTPAAIAPGATTEPTKPFPIACGDVMASEIILNVVSVVAIDVGGGETPVIVQKTTVRLADLEYGFLISFSAAQVISGLKIVLGPDNILIDSTGTERRLLQPSLLDSGVKVAFSSPMTVQTGKTYRVHIPIESNAQFKPKPEGCMIHPVWSGSTLL